MSKLVVNTLLILIILFFSCKDSPSTTSQTNQNEIPVLDSIVTPEPPAITEIYAWVNELRMREEPSTSSPVVIMLKEGESLDFKGEKSDFTEKINIRGAMFDEPWLKVTTKTGKEGWVYGGGVKFYKVGADKSSTPYDDCLRLEKDRKVTQAEKCFQRVQFRQLKDNHSIVSASASGIELRLLSGEQLNLQNVGKDTIYDFRYYIKNMGYFVVLGRYNNAEEYILVNDKSGKTVNLKGYPKASPEGNHIAGVGTDWKGTGKFNGVQILSYLDNDFKVVFEENFEDYNPVMLKWVDDDTLQFTLLEQRNRKKSKIAQLARDKSGVWSLDL